MVQWAWLVAACTFSEPVVIAPPEPAPPFALTEGAVPGFPDLRTAIARPVLLHRTEGTLRWPTPRLPEALADVGEAFDVRATEVPRSGNLRIFRAPVPFALSKGDQIFRPEGMRVTVDGTIVPFSRTPVARARRATWRIAGRNLVLTHPTPPDSVTIAYPGVAEALAAHDPAQIDVHARGSLTLKGLTRSGLRMPAPAVAEWALTPPSGATFEAHLALEPPPVPGFRSDGASFVVTVVREGRAIELARQAVEPGAFAKLRVDLSAYAETPVTLRLSTDPGADPTFDWVFVGAPTVWGTPDGDVRRIVVVGIDTTRPDHLSFFGYDRPTTPELDAVLGTSVVFDRTWSTAPRTRPAFRSATTGLRPLEAVGAPSIGATLSRHGFATGAVVANIHLQPRFGFSEGFDHWFFDGKAKADGQVDRALAWLDEHADRDSFLFLHLMDPHLRYDAPPPYKDRFVEDPDPTLPDRATRGQIYGWMRDGSLTARRKAHLEALHDGELAFTSAQLGRFFERLDALPGRTLVVVHTDHGEEFWEHGSFEHNHTVYDEVTRALLAFRPGGGRATSMRTDIPASLVDIAPTLYDLLGIVDLPDLHGRSLVPLFEGGEATGFANRALPVAHVQYLAERWAVVVQGYKYVLFTGSGEEVLYDLVRDPAETRDLSGSQDLNRFREHLREVHQLAMGPGFRVRLEQAPTFRLELPAPPRLVRVLDPETLIDHRANIEWGELPARVPADIGEVAVEGRTVTFAPGVDPSGVVVVLFEDDVVPDAAATVIGLAEGSRNGPEWASGDARIAIEPGTVLVPPPTEAARMGIGPGAAGAADEARELCMLGYTKCADP